MENIDSIEYQNPVLNEDGTIDCEINHTKLGWIPFTASPDDPEESGREIFKRISESEDNLELKLEHLDNIARLKRRDIEKYRDEAISSGFEYDFDGTTDVVQMRKRDRENITGLAVSAQRNPEGTFTFRAESNKEHNLTADEMLDLADASQSHASAKYQHSWKLKNDIDKALEEEDRETLNSITWG